MVNPAAQNGQEIWYPILADRFDTARENLYLVQIYVDPIDERFTHAVDILAARKIRGELIVEDIPEIYVYDVN